MGVNPPAATLDLDDEGRDLLAIRVDSATNQVVGILCFYLLTELVPTRPDFFAFFELATKRGVGPETLDHIKRHVERHHGVPTDRDVATVRRVVVSLAEEIAAGRALGTREPRTDPAMAKLNSDAIR